MKRKKFKQYDHPFDECCKTAKKIVDSGGTIIQKWWCLGCGSRCSANNPNVMAMECRCEHCDMITNVVEHGCNYTAVLPFGLRVPGK